MDTPRIAVLTLPASWSGDEMRWFYIGAEIVPLWSGDRSEH